ncbi:helix-turn-helix domain-containing protein [Halomicroarcula sp. F13]|uniref:Helix-turn-helix domain-containing protein n=1 Tax=Haloarcula rubra TaxID=2487747 RepID=A0AAW4PXU3_9EURY|nr:helix-turn-helix domain-containing protein [Halomicroarcula rubra]MBX0326014.1 helix-turn-helix domain-containing protein [Halomicroarcula rubra]
MRYLTVSLRPTDGEGFHPLGKRLTAEASIQREAIHHVELIDDGTMLMLAEGSGDRERYEDIMASSSFVHEYMVSGEERWMAVSRFDPTEPVRRVMEWRRQADVVVETPILFRADGSQRITVIGDEAAFKDMYQEAMSLDSFAFEVVETGEYDPNTERFTRSLTPRQQEVLAAAVDVGYYRAPREATHEDVAAAVGLAPSTVGDHLRKIEERVFETIVQ